MMTRQRRCAFLLFWWWLLLQLPQFPIVVDSFSFSGGHRRNHPRHGGNPPTPPRGPPPFRGMQGSDGADGPGGSEGALLSAFPISETNQDKLLTNSTRTRGGASSSSSSSSTKNAAAADTLASSASFWKKAAAKVGSVATAPFRAASKAVSRLFRGKEDVMEEELLRELSTLPVQRIEVSPNATILPKQVVQLAARRAGMLGQPLQPERVQELARALKRWYARQGYVLHHMSGATLEPESQTAIIQLKEPVIAQTPVDIVFCQEFVVDGETGELLTRKQYKERQEKAAIKRRGKKPNRWGIGKNDNGDNNDDNNNRNKQQVIPKPNTTLVETSGRTRPHKLASALQLRPGQPFQWDGRRWKAVQQSGVFRNILQASPQPLEDGSVQLQIVAQEEEKSTHLEYGLGTSRYTGSWEGELDLERRNLLGGGESLGLSVRRGARDPEPSVRLRFCNDNFGLDGGYEVEAFSDFIGDDEDKQEEEEKKRKFIHEPKLPKLGKLMTWKSSTSEQDASLTAAGDGKDGDGVEVTEADYDNDILVDRRGASFRIRNPLDVNVIENSAASCSFERTSTKGGLHENIGSCTLHLGPFPRQLPLDARSNVDAKLTTGTRVQTKALYNEQDFLDRFDVSPFATASATVRQTFPLISTNTAHKRPVVLALRHSLTTSTPNLPRHEARAQGIANTIRDSTENGRVSNALRGTTELRIPVDLPRQIWRVGGSRGGGSPNKNVNENNKDKNDGTVALLSQQGQGSYLPPKQDGRVVLFGDWLFANADLQSPIYRKSSVGVGLRKSIQGIPVRYDLCYTWEGKIRGSVSLGRDFEA